jgi:flagellar basal-body rod protein FlgC
MPQPLEIPRWSQSERQLMPSLVLSAQGMAAQMKFLEAIAANIANAEMTETAEGGPFRRRIAVLDIDPQEGVLRTRVVEDDRPGRLIYDPAHPHANEEGFVEYPNIDLNEELVDLMIARRIHQANATVFQAAKGMLRSALDI